MSDIKDAIGAIINNEVRLSSDSGIYIHYKDGKYYDFNGREFKDPHRFACELYHGKDDEWFISYKPLEKRTLQTERIKFDYWEEGFQGYIQFQEYPDELRDIGKIGYIHGVSIESHNTPHYYKDRIRTPSKEELQYPESGFELKDEHITPQPDPKCNVLGHQKDFDSIIIQIPLKDIRGIADFSLHLLHLLKDKLEEITKD